MPEHMPQQCKPKATTNNQQVYKNGGSHGKPKTSAEAIAEFTEEKLPQSKGWTPNDRISVARALGKVFDVQKQFGKTPAQLQTIIEGFCWALQRYPAGKSYGRLVSIFCSVLICQHHTTPGQIIDPV